MNTPRPDPRDQIIKELQARVAWLADTVVMAASLWAGDMDDNPSKRDYASEVLHTTAVDLVRENPRMAGHYPKD